jgi:fatty-acyl-CoA synthase
MIGMLGQNSAIHLATLLGCARAGLAMVPINWRLAEEEWCWQARAGGLCAVVEGFGHRMPQDFMATEGITAIGQSTIRLLPREPVIGTELGRAELPALVGYTSGTTGRPKGAILTQAALLANATNAQALFEITPDDRVLTILPMFHVGGLNIQTLPALLAGAEIILQQKFDADEFFDALAQHRPTLTLLVPAVMAALIAHPRWNSAEP